MKGKWLGAWGKDFQRGCLYRIIAVVLVVPLFAACILAPLYFSNRPGVTDTEFLLITIIPAVLFLVVLFGSGFGFVFWSLRRRAAWLDEIFIPLGLEGRRYATTGRQYHGRVRGRDMDVLFVRGPTLSIYLSTNLYTRASASDSADVSQKLAKAFNKMPIEAGTEDMTIFAQEEEWGREFAADPEVQKLLRDLIFNESPFYIRQVQIEPGYIVLRLYRSKVMFDFQIPPEQGKRWVDALFRLAELAERQDAPQEKMAPSTLNANIREGKAARWGWIIVAVVVVMGLCLAVFSIGLIFLMESGI